MPRSCLVISPVPTIPRDQGNAVNLSRLNLLLQAAGFLVHFVYSTLEGLAPNACSGMAGEWDRFDVIRHDASLPTATCHGYGIDDWYNPAVSDHVRALFEAYDYDLVIVHYAWMTAIREALPSGVPLWLYTHDRFADRHAMLVDAGIAPTWFSTKPDQEAIGLNRCDLIIATQEAEAEWFSSLTERPVLVLGAPIALRDRPARCKSNGDAWAAGYLGSANPSNIYSMTRLLDAIDRSPLAGDKNFSLVMAGQISLHEQMDRPYIRRLGVIGHADELYRQVDVIVNPSEGGSGLKIKSVEALAAGMPLVSTLDGMHGMRLSHPAMACDGPYELVQRLIELGDESKRVALMRAAGETIRAYAQSQIESFLDALEILAEQ